MRFLDDRDLAKAGEPLLRKILHAPAGWSSLATMTGWPGLLGRCRYGCLPSRPACGRGCRLRCAHRGFDPVYDRGQVLVDLALMLILGGEAISDFQGLRHLSPVISPVPSTPMVWRRLSEAGDLQLARVNAAVTRFRRHWWGILAARPDGFPWLRVADRELTGITVVDLDASIVFAASPALHQLRNPGLSGGAIAAVPAAPPGRVVFLIAQVAGHLLGQRPLQHRLGHLGQQAIQAEQLHALGLGLA